MNPVDIAGISVGPGTRCFVIAEAGVNHDGDPERARRLVDAAADAGADAVKFQTFRADRLASPEAPKADYQRRSTDAGESQLTMLRRLELPRSAYPAIQARCAERGILFLSSAFDEEDADFLAQLDAPAIKIPSGELTNLPFLAHAARLGRPLIVSTGMATLREVEAAVAAVREAGGCGLVLLHCVSRYPAPAAHANLNAMRTLTEAFGVPAGFSDHTPGIAVAVAAAALGASVIEKHLTLDRSLPGPDHAASLDPGEFRALVEGIRTAEAARGHGRKEPAPGEAEIAAVVRKSIVAARDLPAGATLTEDAIAARRPGTGFPPGERARVVGRVLKTPVRAGTVFRIEMFA